MCLVRALFPKPYVQSVMEFSRQRFDVSHCPMGHRAFLQQQTVSYHAIR